MYYHYYLQACFVSMHLALTALDKNDVNIFSIIFFPHQLWSVHVFLCTKICIQDTILTIYSWWNFYIHVLQYFALYIQYPSKLYKYEPVSQMYGDSPTNVTPEWYPHQQCNSSPVFTCLFILPHKQCIRFFCLHSHRKRLLNWFWEWAVWQHKAVVSVIEECDFKMLNVFLALGLNKENCPYSELKSAVLCIWFIALATRNQPKFSINQLLSRKTSFFFLMT